MPKSKDHINPNTSRTIKDNFSIDSLELVKAIRSGDRKALAQGITLLESTLLKHQEISRSILSLKAPHTTTRIAVSGPPGVGKSTFIEQFGLHLCEEGKKVAVLTIDPSSSISGGSILGDKTRMKTLSNHPSAFIRPSPTKGFLGGIAAHTREALHLCEVAGFDMILIETVGVGQSEMEASEMVDVFLLLQSPIGGDELQGIKKGILEIADFILVNKCDGDLKLSASKTYGEIKKLISSSGRSDNIFMISALENSNIVSSWNAIYLWIRERQKGSTWIARRLDQDVRWLAKTIQFRTIPIWLNQPNINQRLDRIKQLVAAQEINLFEGAFRFFDQLNQQIK